MTRPKIIAFYLPQFHPTKENDEWWGRGFTEWTNVGKAKPLFWGHLQPKVPADLGYYDLRLAEVREQQAELARDAGVEGFCYWHYWFGNGKELLERPFKEVLESGKPDFPFCLGWANESWKKKLWNKDAVGDQLLIKQEYNGIEDYTEHFYSVLKAFKDDRYIKIDGKPIFLIYKPFDSSEIPNFMQCWNDLAQREGLPGIFWIAHCANEKYSYEEYRKLGFDYINTCYILRYFECRPFLKKCFDKIVKILLHHPSKVDYKTASKYFYPQKDFDDNRIFPTIITGWDHTPRSGIKGVALTKYTPKIFKEVVSVLFKKLSSCDKDYNLVFLKSWNEWGEGNYIEPDLMWGRAFLDVLSGAVCENSKEGNV